MEAITHNFTIAIFQGFSVVEQTLENGRWSSAIIANGDTIESWEGLEYPGEEAGSNTYPFICEECGETFFFDNSHADERQAKNHHRSCHPMGFLVR